MSLALSKISKRFGGVVAADDVTMDVPSGSVTGLIGPNGAGKTTLINLITGLLTQSAGRISLDGVDLTEASASGVARSGVARTFQNIRLLPEQNVLENVMLGFHRLEKASTFAALLDLRASRVERAHFSGIARDLLHRFGMVEYADVAAGGLAYGHQRRVEIMRALASSPRVILLDEPVAGMSDVEARELGRIFSEVAEGGVAVLLIEHNIRFITEFCRHIYVLDRGRVIADGPPAETMREPLVVAAYMGE